MRKGLPFRDCHEIVGHAVKYGVDSGKDLAEMSLDELRRFSEQIDADVFDVLTSKLGQRPRPYRRHRAEQSVPPSPAAENRWHSAEVAPSARQISCPYPRLDRTAGQERPVDRQPL